MNMPELVGERICRIINANGDERIDHDEFIKFFTVALMGSKMQKMHIAFKCYDSDNDDYLTADQVKVVLRNIPFLAAHLSNYGLSHKSTAP
mmetsp:Transcript_30581/g.46900  ORF Transcript_30581/g.46900 Transcript_30581/m.46900 type:complete len:91 (+) Transcript_30581:282-554(+)